MKAVSTKLPEPMIDKLDEISEKQEESRSAVIRNLLRGSLERRDSPDEDRLSFGCWIAFTGWTLAVAAFVSAPDSAGIAGFSIVAAGIAYDYFA